MDQDNEPQGLSSTLLRTGFSATEPTTYQGLLSGDNELWLIQCPRQVNVQKLQGTTLRLRVAHQSGLMGSLTDASGTEFCMREESTGMSDQLHIIAGSPDQSNPVVVVPVQRKVTLARDFGLAEEEEEEPTALPSHILNALTEPHRGAVDKQQADPATQSSKKRRKEDRTAAATGGTPDLKKQKKKKHRETEAAGGKEGKSPVVGVPQVTPVLSGKKKDKKLKKKETAPSRIKQED